MKISSEMQKQIQFLFETQKLCVLSTQSENGPYASLVAFVADGDLKKIYFITPRTTRKFSNMEKDSRVALLINSSINEASDFHDAISVTATGKAEEISPSERERILQLYLEKHHYLEHFVSSPTSALMCVCISSYYMVQNFQNVMELHINHE